MDIFTSCFVTFTVAMLFVAMLGGIYGSGRKRVFLGGFAIGAWGFLVLAYGAFRLESFGSQMLTAQAIQYVGSVFIAEDPSALYYASLNPLGDARGQVDLISNCVFTLSFGLVCALVARRFAQDGSRNERPAESRFKVLVEPAPRREFATSSRGDQ